MRIFEPRWWHGNGAAHRLVGPVILLTLVTVGTLIYLLPGNSPGEPTAKTITRSAAPGPAGVGPSVAAAPVTTPSSSPTASTRPASAPTPTPAPTKAEIIREITERVRTVDVGSTVTAHATSTRTATPKTRHCWEFKWQQDAQAAYRANLSDPGGLDGDPGPHNGDGLACTTLPVDPNRPASRPVDAYQAPAATAAGKTALVAPKLDYFGVTENGLPNSAKQYDSLANQVGKAPSSIGFFAYWTDPFPAAKVTTSWQHGALPVMSWMSMPATGDAGAFSLTRILAGDWDDYLYKFAGDIVRTNLPIVIRFDHEMNGTWYPWSAGRSDWNNSPTKYVAMWRHVWNIFQQVGANDDAIWLFAPARVDNITGVRGGSTIAADFPGPDYVDWVGATVYWRNGTQPTDYRTSFGKTIDSLRATTAKPLFFPEIGALQTYKGADVSAGKEQWIRNTMQGFLADASVVGFNWFNNVATTPEDPDVAHDWRFNASGHTLATFTDQITDARFAGGVMPDKSGA